MGVGRLPPPQVENRRRGGGKIQPPTISSAQYIYMYIIALPFSALSANAFVSEANWDLEKLSYKWGSIPCLQE